MKKSLLALAVLGAFAGVASAQSSVTLFGIVDLSAKYVKNDAAKRRVSLSQDGINSSRLGFKGVEDLGGGLKAGFWLEGGVSADTGQVDTTRFFGRRATVSLLGNFGEVRLGRDYTPSFWNMTIFDAFGTNGVGNSLNVQQLTSATRVRADNSIGYLLPSNIGGVYGQFQVASGEAATATVPGNPGRYVGGRVGFAAGPFDIAGSYAEQRISGGTSIKSASIGGAYDFGVLKLLSYYNQVKQGSDKDQVISLSTVVPMGQGEIHVGYDYDKRTNAANVTTKVDQFKAGYVYSLSKRTAMYSTVSRLKNKNGTGNAIAGGNAYGTDGAVPSAPKSLGLEVGLRHIF
ncbi:MAG: porin [Burkholderiales bacterium]